jgi:hypothetical protein
MSYITKTNIEAINIIKKNGESVAFSISCIEESIKTSHLIFEKLNNFSGVNLFEILGMRNLSALIGEVFAKKLEEASNGALLSNPHQDGYPDLMLMDNIGKEMMSSYGNKLRDKAPFSPFANGGIEIKCTCGSVPTDSICKKRGYPHKPGLGDTRMDLLVGYDWKAHHRETNNLIGILWDFIDSVPAITAIFYSNKLVETDWGKIIQPKTGGGRTTSVSIMTRIGVKKMYEGWIYVSDSTPLIKFLNKHNKDNLIAN